MVCVGSRQQSTLDNRGLKTEAGASLPYFLIPLYLVVREHGISFQSLPPFRQAIQGRSHQRFSPRSSRQLR